MVGLDMKHVLFGPPMLRSPRSREKKATCRAEDVVASSEQQDSADLSLPEAHRLFCICSLLVELSVPRPSVRASARASAHASVHASLAGGVELGFGFGSMQGPGSTGLAGFETCC